jgi:hypothetical protein
MRFRGALSLGNEMDALKYEFLAVLCVPVVLLSVAVLIEWLKEKHDETL